ncbi:MAG: type I DNA topoisomerase [Alphaproteobacteria bacterium]|nr:type I DNA topoisomerase [Alphaproteobacteria bacterium]
MNVVVVESPAKAKTINNYLGADFKVLASYGHVRDLPAKDGSVRPDEGFAMTWTLSPKADARVDAIAKALTAGDTLFLATDPDREGEAISWHVLELLRERGVLDDVSVKRVVFNEITKAAVLEAVAHPRDLDEPLIEAYLARRALDYLVGFTLSPVLWRKLPGSRSAGRVQSVALRLICEREAEIEVFKPREYWTVDAGLTTAAGSGFTARLTHLGGEKLGKYDIPDQDAADNARQAIVDAGAFSVASVERKEARRNPPPPFITSTLQQEASRKLRLSARQTMQIAQRLYEGVDLGGETVGLITYMRTDSVHLAAEALAQARSHIETAFGAAYLPDQPRRYRSSARNAQEAHEAIRPTNMSRNPSDLRHVLDGDQFRLYELIWKRAVASQMASARLDQVAIEAEGGDGVTLRATGSVIAFDGFLKLYQEGRDDPNGNGAAASEDQDRMLPPMKEGERLALGDVKPEQHFTQPPPRFTEASLVKRLEELGIGRPSTYASILSVLQDRNYVTLESRRFVPEDRGRVVTAFLSSFFRHYVEYDFTAQLEEQLDDISAGRANWKSVLGNFWADFAKAVDETKGLTITQVIDALDADLGPHFFPLGDDGTDPRKCPGCSDGRLGLKLGKFGAFIGCSNYPDCKFTRKLAVANGAEDDTDAALAAGPIELGTDSASGGAVSVRKGPYGPYVQLDEVKSEGDDKAKAKPKRVSIPKGLDPKAIDLETALGLLSLPRQVGTHPETGKPIRAGIGRFGPYVESEGKYASIPADEDVLTIGLNRAVDLLASARKRGRGANSGKEIGVHPDDGKPVTLHSGRYGPYVKHGRINATVPAATDPDALTLEDAIALIAAKAAKGPAKGKRGAGAKAKGKAGTGGRGRTRRPSADASSRA